MLIVSVKKFVCVNIDSHFESLKVEKLEILPFFFGKSKIQQFIIIENKRKFKKYYKTLKLK